MKEDQTSQLVKPLDTALRIKDVCKILGLSRSTIYAKIKCTSKQYDPDFPKPFKLATNAVAWSLIDINNWLYAMKEKGTKYFTKQ